MIIPSAPTLSHFLTSQIDVNFVLKMFVMFQSVPGVVESMKIVTDENSERVARYAFEYGV